MAASYKKPVTLSIDNIIKKQFQIECLINGNEMSTAIESMMSSYVETSKRMRLEKEKK